MKKAIGILMILFITITIFSCDKDKEKDKVETNDLINSQIKGNVKYWEEIEYTVFLELGEVKNDFEVKRIIKKYNREGNIVSAYDRMEGFKYFYKYDSKNVMNETMTIWFNDKGEEQETKGVFKYDEKGNKIEMEIYGNGVFKGIEMYKYDRKGYLIEENEFNENSELVSKYTYKYNSKGKKIERNSFITTDEIDKKTIIEYDSIGNLIEVRDYEYKNLVERNTAKYDSVGNEIELCRYGSKGNLIEKSIMKHEFDKNLNPIRTIIYDKDNKANRVIERKFVYYGDKDENEFQDWENEMKETVLID